LADEDQGVGSISVVRLENGSLANFNRQFKALKLRTPRDYRNSFRARR
jgi:hypothetical protein